MSFAVCPLCHSWIGNDIGHVCTLMYPNPAPPAPPVYQWTPAPLTADEIRKIVCEELDAWEQRRSKKSGASPPSSAPPAAVQRRAAPSNEGAEAATVGAGPFERLCDRCKKVVRTAQPVTTTVFYCSLDCAD